VGLVVGEPVDALENCREQRLLSTTYPEVIVCRIVSGHLTNTIKSSKLDSDETKQANNCWYRIALEKGLNLKKCQTIDPIYFQSKLLKEDIVYKEFSELTLGLKQQIQSELKSNGYYKSKVDGLYGKGTAAALKAYNKEYLSDADLTKSANVQALLDDLLREKPTDEEAEPKVKVTLNLGSSGLKVELGLGESPKVEEPAAPPLDFPQLKASYDAGNFTQAFREASTLSVEGNPDAQRYLGKMYADGRGTLQVTTSAHMWFNIASMNGSDEAFEERKAIQSQMTPELINEAQKMAVACIKSDYKDCGLLVQPSENEEQVVKKFQPTASDLRSYFINQPTLQRKQMQYALKKLGYYKSTVDGLWGKGTRAAVEEYIAFNSSVNELDKIYESLTSEVDVPSYFAASVQKKKAATEVVKTQPKFLPSQGYISYGNPTMSVAQALDACKGTALNARHRASDAARFKSNSYSGNCYGNSYSTNCNARKNSPYGNDLGTAMAIGVMEGLTRGMAGKQAAERELKSCMAHYGWRKS
jgi:peptidoglycan hydrolase-like protein with peptidoglycan-binding domain